MSVYRQTYDFIEYADVAPRPVTRI